LTNTSFIERITATRSLFERNFVIPPQAKFAAAIGAARSMRGAKGGAHGTHV